MPSSIDTTGLWVILSCLSHKINICYNEQQSKSIDMCFPQKEKVWAILKIIRFIRTSDRDSDINVLITTNLKS